jgi:MtN3 and saliva related transmembrane protein
VVVTDFSTVIGVAAAICTTVSYFPQLKKTWQTGETDDLSWKMLALLAGGLGLWVVYGLANGDWVIVGANVISVAMVLCILAIKLRAAPFG